MSSRRLREATCLLCGGGQARHLVTARGCEVVRCTACGLVFVWPPPAADELAALYAAGPYHEGLDEAERRRTSSRRLRQVEAVAPRRGRLLDVGCSHGYFLEAAQASGWEAVGVEVNPRAVEAARARGLDVRLGDLCGQAFEEVSFDAVTLLDLLEHTRDPRAVLAACHRVLRPGGLLVVTTPDVGGLVPRVTYGLFGRTLGAWGHPTPPGHLVEFSGRTLRRLLEAEGFEVFRQRSEHIPFAYSAGKLENAIVDVLAGRHRQRIPDSRFQIPDSSPRSPIRDPQCAIRNGPAWRRLPRLGVRLVSWLVVGVAGTLARATAWGDSRWVAARRPLAD